MNTCNMALGINILLWILNFHSVDGEYLYESGGEKRGKKKWDAGNNTF